MTAGEAARGRSSADTVRRTCGRAAAGVLGVTGLTHLRVHGVTVLRHGTSTGMQGTQPWLAPSRRPAAAGLAREAQTVTCH